MKGKIATVFLYLILGVMLLILFIGLDFARFFSLIGRFHYGILKDIFRIVWLIGLIIPVLCYKKMKRIWMLPLCMIIATIITTAVNYGILYGVSEYLSVYTREKWDNFPLTRYCMLDSLNEQYEFIGMTEQELKENLGEPTRIAEDTHYHGRIGYHYVVGDDFTEPHFYVFLLDNGNVVGTTSVQQ